MILKGAALPMDLHRRMILKGLSRVQNVFIINQTPLKAANQLPQSTACVSQADSLAEVGALLSKVSSFYHIVIPAPGYFFNSSCRHTRLLSVGLCVVQPIRDYVIWVEGLNELPLHHKGQMVLPGVVILSSPPPPILFI